MDSSTSFLTAARRYWRVAHCTALCAVALLVPGLAEAANWAIDPVRVELSPEQQTAAINVKNDSDQPASIQIQAVAWAQIGGKDVYTPTKELLVSPPIFTIAPNSEQVVRVALRRQADAEYELTYRINLQELPPQPKPGFTGLQVALRVSLPVFVKPLKGKAEPKMAWNIARMADDTLKLEIQNQGKAHMQISDFALYLPGGDQPIAGESGSSYVLAGQAREWLLKTGSPEKISGGRLRLKAFTDAGDVDTELLLGKQ